MAETDISVLFVGEKSSNKEPDIPITLKCAYCGKETYMMVINVPVRATDLITLADIAKLTSCFDSRYGRVLIFCDKTCAKNSIVKSGRYKGHFKQDTRKKENEK